MVDSQPTEASATRRPRASSLSKRKVLLFSAVLYIGLLLVFEVGARLVFFVKEDMNPFYLTFGFVPNIEWHSDEYDGYTKFQPHSTYRQKIHGEVVPMAINADGFRGASDFVRPKPAGTTRIVAMGASSTFGYYDRDDETYPVYLERLLNESMPARRFEVLNLGIPHYRLNNILALARAELAALEPDVVILYAGYNNAMIHEAPEEGHLLFRLKSWLNFHSVGWRAIKPLVVSAYYRVVETLNRDIGQLPNLHVPVRMDSVAVMALRNRVSSAFRTELNEFADVVADTGATLVPTTQNYRLQGLGNDMDLGKRLTHYAEEVRLIESELEREGGIPAPHSTLLIHRDFMDAFRDLAEERGLPLAEGISAVDGHRDRMMASYVHLTAEGNQRLAAVIAEALERSGTLTK